MRNEKEEIIKFFLDTVTEFEPEKLEEYIAEIKKIAIPHKRGYFSTLL